MLRPRHPPEMDFFQPERPSAGTESITLRLGPIEIEINGLEPGLARQLRERYSPYTSGAAATENALKVRVGIEETDYFIDPPDGMEFVPVRIAADGNRVRYLSYRVAGWFDPRGGRGELLLAGGDYEPADRAIENYVRAAVAWLAANRGGGLVHAASAVWKDQGYLFYGESGAGKSTLSECNRRARVVSDDLSLVLPGDAGPELIGTPFRGTYTGGAPVEGSFPLAAGFRLIQAAEPAVRSVPRPRAMAELVANLPFVAEAFWARPDLFALVQRTFANVPLAHLEFRKDDSYWDAIEAAGYGSRL